MAKRGRKAGSKNRVYEYVTAVAPVCVSCGGQNINRVEGAPAQTQNISGLLPDGREYHSIRWQRSKCECGQYMNVRTYMAEKVKEDNTKAISRE